jgi:hypothetical protein
MKITDRTAHQNNINCRYKKDRDQNVFRILGSMWDKVIGGWTKLHNEELHSLCSSPNIIRLSKSRRMRWAGHALYMGDTRKA